MFRKLFLSFWLTVAPVRIAFSSSNGLSEVTVITSSTAEFMVISRLVLRPMLMTMCGYSTGEKPCSSALILYVAGARLRNRTSPWAFVTWTCGASPVSRVTVTPGRAAPLWSLTLAYRLPVCSWANAAPEPSTSSTAATASNRPH